jgi:NAD(P)-dependent dehydrogenase (short-subunit alcohol dehydrogenase family)
MGRVVVVTGGSAGIGLAAADRFARDGWDVAIVARDQARLDEAAAMLRRAGGAVLAISGDVSDPDAVEAAAERAERELGPIECWVNNAMSTVVAPADKISPAEYQRVTATTYLSQVYGTLAALKRMKPRNHGSIVQVSSGLGFRAAPTQAAYCASKFAVSGFTDSLRAELIEDRVNVSLSVIYLPAVNTPQFTWSRNKSGRGTTAPDPVYDPRLCGEAIFYAADNPQREIWVGNSTVVMALGQALVPSFADRQAAGMEDAMLTEPEPPREGNLDQPAPGPAVMDGPFGDRAIRSRYQFYTSTQRDLFKLGGLGALGVLAGVGAASLLGLRPRLGR